MKNNNLFWGAKKIQGELMKLDKNLDKTTIRNIIREFRKQGKVNKSLTWKKFLKAQIDTIYAMDFFTVDFITNHRFYVYFIIEHKTRRIVQFAITQFPIKEFVRQQLIQFKEEIKDTIYMIHDGTGEFRQNYESFLIEAVRTSFRAPNMNSIAERVIGSIRREALDWFFIWNKNQLQNILTEYITYYNERRPHQSLKQNSPKGYLPQKDGLIETLFRFRYTTHSLTTVSLIRAN